MKEYLFQILILLVLLIPVSNCFSQTDTTGIGGAKPDFVNDIFMERTSMFYVAGKGSVLIDQDIFANTGIYAMFDYKVAKIHAVGTGIGYFIQYYMPRSSESPEYNGLNQGIELNFTYKFLYNLKNRMSRGLTGDNFSANYFFISPEFIYLIKPYSVQSVAWDFTKGAWAINYKHENMFIPWIKMGYGIQRTVKRLTFDLNGGILMGKSEGFFYAQITAGYIFK
jgi:hypothetical protein